MLKPLVHIALKPLHLELKTNQLLYRHLWQVCVKAWCIITRINLRLESTSRSTAARLLRSWVRIPPRAWMFVCCECCVLSGRGLCDELITRPGESYRLWRVVVCDQETSYARRLQPRQRAAKYKPTMGCSASRKKLLLLLLLLLLLSSSGILLYIHHRDLNFPVH